MRAFSSIFVLTCLAGGPALAADLEPATGDEAPVPVVVPTTIRFLGGPALATGAGASRGGTGVLALEIGLPNGEGPVARGTVEAGTPGLAAGVAILWFAGTGLRPFGLVEFGGLASSGTDVSRGYVGAGAGLEWSAGPLRLSVEAHARAAAHGEEEGEATARGGLFLLLAGMGWSFGS